MGVKTLIAGLLVVAYSGLANAQQSGAGQDARVVIDHRIASVQGKITLATEMPVEYAGVLIVMDLENASMNSSRVEVKRMLLDKWIALVEKHGQEAGLEAEMRMKAIFASEDDRRKLESVRPVNARLMELTKRAMDDTRADEAYIDTVDSRSHSDRQALIERKVALYKEELRILVDTRDMLANLLPR